jgi:hypothetical protein
MVAHGAWYEGLLLLTFLFILKDIFALISEGRVIQTGFELPHVND